MSIVLQSIVQSFKIVLRLGEMLIFLIYWQQISLLNQKMFLLFYPLNIYF